MLLKVLTGHLTECPRGQWCGVDLCESVRDLLVPDLAGPHRNGHCRRVLHATECLSSAQREACSTSAGRWVTALFSASSEVDYWGLPACVGRGDLGPFCKFREVPRGLKAGFLGGARESLVSWTSWSWPRHWSGSCLPLLVGERGAGLQDLGSPFLSLSLPTMMNN